MTRPCLSLLVLLLSLISATMTIKGMKPFFFLSEQPHKIKCPDDLDIKYKIYTNMVEFNNIDEQMYIE